jgi:hypothetical protein
MSFSNGPTISTNGLVLALDAGDRNSYVSGSTTWIDLAGTNNGTLTNGPTFNTGSGGSIVFDGGNDYVNIANSNVYSLSSNFTFSCWVKITLTPSSIVGIFGTFDDNNGTGTPFSGWSFWLYTTNNLTYFTLIIGGGTLVYPTIKSDNPYNLNTWYNLTGVNTGGVTYMYVNGIQQTQTIISSILTPVSGSVIGRAYPNTANYYLNGSIASSQIYNRALSASEVLQNYNATKGRFGL